jgi:hypothetical protein
MNPKAPHIYGAIKLHTCTSKERKPIRPIVSWKDSQGYNLAEYTEHTTHNTDCSYPIPIYNIQNSLSYSES